MPSSPILILFVQIGLILASSRILGWLFARLRQPLVMGEMVAGILLGPSFLGLVWPDAWAAIFPDASQGPLFLLSEVGVVFFLFLIGLEFDSKLLKSRGGAILAISQVSIFAPLVLGVGLTWLLRGRLFDGSQAPPFASVALFMGAAMSITAFPVLARILAERNLQKTALGTVTLACASIDDVSAWCLLALAVAVARMQMGSGGLSHAGWVVVNSGIYIAVMFMLVRPLLHRLEIVYQRQGRLSQNVVCVIFLLILASSYATAAIGIHALFGAFLVGAMMPKGTQFVRQLAEKLEDYTVVFLLPIFFAAVGLRTRIGLLNSGELWFYTGLIILVACVGKFGGATLAARACRLDWRESSAIGILMNTRGLMELVILSVGKELGVINDAVFAMMIIMALVTTAMTTPILHLVYPTRLIEGQRRRDKAARQAYSILIPVSLPKSGGLLVQLADTLMDRDGERGKLLALHLHPPVDHAVYRAGLEEALGEADESLIPLLAQARARGLDVEPMSFMSRDIPGDIATIAKAKAIDLVLMGFHQPVLGRNILGGTVHRILAGCETDVAVFVDRGFRQARRILVPFLGSSHDRLALGLAAKMSRHVDAQVVALHVVQPMRGGAEQTLGAKQAVDKIFHDSSAGARVTFRVVEDISPVGVVVHQAQQFDLVIIGVAEQWGLASHLLGWRPERIARDCPSSMLIVRKYGGPGAGGVVMPESPGDGVTATAGPSAPSPPPR